MGVTLRLYEFLSPNGLSEVAAFLSAGHVFSDDAFTRYLTTTLVLGTLRVTFQRLRPPWFLLHAVVNILLMVYVYKMQDYSMKDEEGVCYSGRSAWTWGLAAGFSEAPVWFRAVGATGVGLMLVVWQEARSRARFLGQAAAST
jgi:hypothetical protein